MGTSRAEKFMKELNGVLFLAGLKEPEDAAYKIAQVFVSDVSTKEKKRDIGIILKQNNIGKIELREELYLLFGHYIANLRYRNPYIRYQREMEVCDKWKNLNEAIPGFVEDMKKRVKKDYKNLLTNL